jgi:hypothetical protein
MVLENAVYPYELADQALGKSWERAGPVGVDIDPFSFVGRVSLYKALIDATNVNGLFGERNITNPLWGLPYQLQWQKDSGRLSERDIPRKHGAEGEQSDRIDPNSPWSYGNFSLCVIPYMGAILAGLVPDAHILPAKEDSIFAHAYGVDSASRIVPTRLVPAVEDWRAYFALVSKMQPGDDDEPLRLMLWKAHKASLDAVTEALAEVDQLLYSTTERKFLAGWCRMVDLLAASAWRTDHDAIIKGGIDVLPDRPLQADDVTNDYSAFHDDAKSNVKAVLELADMPERNMHITLWFWRRMMRTRGARDRAEEILHILLSKDSSGMEKLKLLRLLL